QCKNPACIKSCPVEVDIPAFIKLLHEGDFDKAAKKIKEKNCLPAVCGRVCPQENQCEKFCVLTKKGEPVAIGCLERFVADFSLAQKSKTPLPKSKVKEGKVAIIGSGPAGLTAAGNLVKLGYKVTIFEALHEAGGVLTYGIPEFRLPKRIVQAEIDYIKKLGVEIKTNIVIGKLFSIDELFNQGYNAVFIGVGAGLPCFLGIPGENLNGVYSANEFLTRVNLTRAYSFPDYDTPAKVGKKVAVIGGGNVAVDAARTALRMGASQVYLIYRRRKEDMPARKEEIKHAKEEGIIFKVLTLPVQLLGKDGWVTGLECVKTKAIKSENLKPWSFEITEKSHFTMEADIVIIAIGTVANPLIYNAVPCVKLDGRGYILADEESGRTSGQGVFAGGDIVTGAATVVLAMGAGLRAARAIDAYLTQIRDKK
ncbi:MAG: NADPH-dependent glutamate synthase, partial [Candidatus Subteraquimicrobiales bacterium]|nr:NADPH-dependent glutamate synthase [Candidatus Subteraquimicrobiales bacterium]